jgi:hypothetical protein
MMTIGIAGNKGVHAMQMRKPGVGNHAPEQSI